MGNAEDLYFLRFEHRPLTPEQWDRLTRSAVRRAEEMRAQMLRRLFVAILTSVQTAANGAGVLGRRAAAAARRRWRSYVTWRERRRAVKELGLLDDRELKDIGLHRSEIESVVGGPDTSRLTERKVAAVLVHKPCAKRSVAANGAPKQLIERTAA